MTGKLLANKKSLSYFLLWIWEFYHVYSCLFSSHCKTVRNHSLQLSEMLHAKKCILFCLEINCQILSWMTFSHICSRLNVALPHENLNTFHSKVPISVNKNQLLCLKKPPGKLQRNILSGIVRLIFVCALPISVSLQCWLQCCFLHNCYFDY